MTLMPATHAHSLLVRSEAFVLLTFA